MDRVFSILIPETSPRGSAGSEDTVPVDGRGDVLRELNSGHSFQRIDKENWNEKCGLLLGLVLAKDQHEG